jgi:hypothetical protein
LKKASSRKAESDMRQGTVVHSRLFMALLLIVLGLTLGISGPSPVFGQQDQQEESADKAPTVSLDDLLEEDEFALVGEGDTYDGEDRRDPFKSLLIARQGPLLRGPRPVGIPGLLIEEIDLTGIFVTPAGPVAQVQSTQGEKSHLLHEGDQLYDGDVISISTTEMVFKQIVDDPTAVKPFREVVKKLNP